MSNESTKVESREGEEQGAAGLLDCSQELLALFSETARSPRLNPSAGEARGVGRGERAGRSRVSRSDSTEDQCRSSIKPLLFPLWIQQPLFLSDQKRHTSTSLPRFKQTILP